MDKKFKIVVAGCGAISTYWLDYTVTRKDCEIAGLVDIRKESAEKIAERYQLSCGIFTGVTEAVEKTGANLLFDLTFVTAHKDVTIDALARGCDVFCEKPMAFAREEAISMVNAAEKYGRTLTVMQNRRYTKGIRALKELIRSGTIGKPGFICADIFVPEDLNSIRNLLEKPMLQDNAIHTFDQARFLLDADPVTVYCHSFNPAGSKYRGDAAGVCIYEMSDGTVFCFRCMMGVIGCRTSWESAWRIIGSRGTAIWDGVNNPYCEILSEDNIPLRIEGTTSWDNHGRTQHGQGLAEMFQALIEGRKAETDCTDNIKSISMVFAALESSENGKKVFVMNGEME